MKEYLNTTEAAEYLEVSDRTIRKLCEDRKIEHERLNGRNIRIRPEWLDNYRNTIHIKPIDHSNSELEKEI